MARHDHPPAVDAARGRAVTVAEPFVRDEHPVLEGVQVVGVQPAGVADCSPPAAFRAPHLRFGIGYEAGSETTRVSIKKSC